MLVKNTWKHLTVYKLFVFDRNTWYHLTLQINDSNRSVIKNV